MAFSLNLAPIAATIGNSAVILGGATFIIVLLALLLCIRFRSSFPLSRLDGSGIHWIGASGAPVIPRNTMINLVPRASLSRS